MPSGWRIIRDVRLLPRTPLALALCTLAATMTVPTPALAQRGVVGSKVGTSDFWEDLAHPGRRKYEEAMKKGRELYRVARSLRDKIYVRTGSSSPTARLRLQYLKREYNSTLKRALAQLKRATAAAPKKAEGHYRYAEVLYETDHYKECIAAYALARRLDPSYANDHEIALNLALAHTKLGKYERSIPEYDRLERIMAKKLSRRGYRRAKDSMLRTRSMSHSNAAEMLMLMGRLEESIRRFHEGLRVSSRMRSYGYRNEMRKQAYWGLAVAYDRDEQVGKALEYARKAVSGQPRMQYLHSSSVFFVPDGEINYYVAMGYLAQGKREQARKFFQAFLQKLPRDQWAPRARAHLNQLSATTPATTPSKKRLAPAPGTTRRDPTSRDRSSAEYRIRSSLPNVSKCYDKLLKRERDASGRLKVGVLISAKGKVRRAKIVYSTVGDRRLHACVLGHVRKIQFNTQSTGKALKMEYAFQFSPRR